MELDREAERIHGGGIEGGYISRSGNRRALSQRGGR